MLDTLANVDDPLLAGARIEQQYFLDGADAIAAGIEHGSIVAALLAGQKDFGLLPHAALSIAGIFTLDEEGQPIASATSFVAGLDWLASQGIKTINTSLSGPHDGLMEMAIGAALKHDIAIVAAAGNDGLSDVPQFPAAYSGVIGVTAIDADRKPFTRANTGSFVTFAAPGVDLWIPVSNASAGTSGQAKGEIVAGNYVSGTSFAAPFVAAALAASGNNADNLASAAIDLGPKGRDPVFGYGLVQAPMNCATANN
jgi:hypothetical protein